MFTPSEREPLPLPTKPRIVRRKPFLPRCLLMTYLPSERQTPPMIDDSASVTKEITMDTFHAMFPPQISRS